MKEKKKQTMYLLKKMSNSCIKTGDFSLCKAEECFSCPECDCCIANEDGDIIRKFKKIAMKDCATKIYKIEIYDEIDELKIEEYLVKPSSNYTVTSIDGVVLKELNTEPTKLPDFFGSVIAFFKEKEPSIFSHSYDKHTYQRKLK